jgi:hypothetical protein
MKVVLIILLVILILLEMAFFGSALSSEPLMISRRSAARACMEWHKNPTPENEAAWLREKTAMWHEQQMARIVFLGLLILNSVGMVMVIRHLNLLRRVKSVGNGSHA